MTRMVNSLSVAGTALGLLLFASPVVIAQSGNEEQSADDEFVPDAVEEIVVIGERPGDPRRLDRIYEDPLKTRILREIRQLRVLEEEYEWRRETATVDGDPPRIRWGYDPRDELRTRRDNELFDLPMERTTQPATIFSVDF